MTPRALLASVALWCALAVPALAFSGRWSSAACAAVLAVMCGRAG
jgi:hypothetical protein